MPGSASGHSTYSTASHLLSPGSSNPPPASSVASTGSRPSRRPASSSAYPSSSASLHNRTAPPARSSRSADIFTEWTDNRSDVTGTQSPFFGPSRATPVGDDSHHHDSFISSPTSQGSRLPTARSSGSRASLPSSFAPRFLRLRGSPLPRSPSGTLTPGSRRSSGSNQSRSFHTDIPQITRLSHFQASSSQVSAPNPQSGGYHTARQSGPGTSSRRSATLSSQTSGGNRSVRRSHVGPGSSRSSTPRQSTISRSVAATTSRELSRPVSPISLLSGDTDFNGRKAFVSPSAGRKTPSVTTSASGFSYSRSIASRLGLQAGNSYAGLGASSDTIHEALDEVIMAMQMDKDGKVGCAYYSAIDETLFLEEDVPLGGLEIAQTLLLGTEPTTVIVSNRSPGHFTELLEANAQRFEDDRTSSGEQGSYILRHFPSTKFNYETAKEALADIEIEPYEPITVVTGSAGADSSLLVHHAKLVRLARLINLENYLAVGCAGAVLYDLERRRAVEDMQTGTAHSAFRIKSLRMNESMDAMLLNADALLSLQIVHPERRRDLLFSDPIKHKDSRSVVALLQAFTSTILGQKRLRQMLLRPTTSLDIIQERQAAIQTFLFPENAEIVGSLRKLLKKLKDPKSLLAKVKKGVGRLRGELCLPLNDWKSLPRFGMLVANVRQSALTVVGGQRVTILSRICNEIDVLLFVQMGQRIMQTIDFKVSEDSGHGVIMSGISECLDQLRQELSDLYGMLPEIRDAVAQETPQWADQHIHHCTMMPQFGFLVGVLLDQETGQAAYCGQETTDDEWEFRFQTEEFAYYKNKLLLDLDTEYGDLPVRITEEEIDVVMELSASVMEHEATIIRASELYAELDSLLAMASAAEKYRWVAPQMTTANVIDIVDGRHPIQELRVESSFIPNSCRMRGARWASDLDEPFDDEQGDERAPWDDIRENYSEDELASERGGKANSTMGSSMGSDSGGTPRSEGYAEAQDEITSVWGHEKANEQEIPAETSEMDSEPRSEDSIERETDARRRLRDDVWNGFSDDNDEKSQPADSASLLEEYEGLWENSSDCNEEAEQRQEDSPVSLRGGYRSSGDCEHPSDGNNIKPSSSRRNGHDQGPAIISGDENGKGMSIEEIQGSKSAFHMAMDCDNGGHEEHTELEDRDSDFFSVSSWDEEASRENEGEWDHWTADHDHGYGENDEDQWSTEDEGEKGFDDAPTESPSETPLELLRGPYLEDTVENVSHLGNDGSDDGRERWWDRGDLKEDDGLGDGNNSEEQTVYDGPPSILILTGANNSGKTIYMKQVALIVFLAHTGSFVPAESATIGVTDRILTRLSTRETVLEDESAFLIDIKQAAFAANFATRRSLLLIDEFGKGTNPECGAAIFASFLRNFLEPREYRPKILASTHFHEVFEAGLIGVQEGVAVAHMEVHIDKNAVDIRDQITYLHRLQPGHAKESLAIMCAEMAGIPPRVLDRADDIVELLNANEDITAALPELVEQSRRAHKEAKRVLRGVFLIPEADLEAAQNGDESVDIRAMLENILAEAEDAGFLGDGNLAEVSDEEGEDGSEEIYNSDRVDELGANGMGSGGSKYGSTEDGQMEDSEVENGEMKTGDEMEGVTCSLTSRSAAW